MAKKEDTQNNPFQDAIEATKEKTVTIDGETYSLKDLSEDTRNQMVNLKVAEQEVARLNRLLAITQTARNAYAKALAESLPKEKKAKKSVQ